MPGRAGCDNLSAMAVAQDLVAERLALVDRLRGLPEQQWQTPSLCQGWTVHHVLAHLTTPFLIGRAAMGMRFLRGRGVAGGMDNAARELAQRRPQELLDVLEQNAGSTIGPPGLGLVPPMADAIVHSVDIRWPLGDPHDDHGNPSRLLPVLDFLMGPKSAAGFLPPGRRRGLRLVATDQSWAHGKGAEISGPSLALVLGLLGRAPALAELSGPGVPVLTGRLP